MKLLSRNTSWEAKSSHKASRLFFISLPLRSALYECAPRANELLYAVATFPVLCGHADYHFTRQTYSMRLTRINGRFDYASFDNIE